MLPETWYCN